MRFLNLVGNVVPKKRCLGLRFLALTVGLGFSGAPSFAYTVPTHKILTEAAVKKSVIVTDPAFMNNLGLGAGQKFFSFAGILPVQQQLLSVTDLVAYGAQYEDQLNVIGAPPHVSVYHFFDPQYSPPTGRGLTLAGWTPGAPSPDWILETRGVTFGDQYFSYSKALNKLYLALSAANPAVRNDAFGMVFQSLGHMVHHVQDMGQPQHVRNEAHLDYPFKTNAARFEEDAQDLLTVSYIDQVVARKNYPLPSVRSVPALKRATEYWYSASPSYVGMAEFTAKNFVTYNTGYEFTLQNGAWTLKGNSQFPFPNGSNQPNQSLKEIVASTRTVRTVDGQPVTKPVSCVKGTVYDAFYPAASTQQLLACSGVVSKFSPGYVYLNWDSPEVWAANHEVLVPRIVSFSAGLINHFFRGQVGVEKKSANDWLLVNQSWENTSGIYNIFFEDSAGVRTQVTQFPLSLSGGAAATVSFNPPDNVEKIIVAFKGQLGEESGQVHGRVISYKKSESSISVGVDSAAVVSGAAVNMVATVAGNAPTGSVQFMINGVAKGSPVALDGGGRASLSSGPLNEGTYQVSAEYLGDSSNKKKSSTAIAVTSKTPAIPCGTSINASGGTEGYQGVMDMGNTAGRVTVQFETYTVPDGLVVSSVSSGATFASTGGWVSGYREFKFDFDSAAHGGRNVKFKVNANTGGTAWVLTASCPGQTLPGPPTFRATFGVSVPQGKIKCGNWTFLVDNSTSIRDGGRIDLTSSGSHTLKMTWAQGSCPNHTSSVGTSSYDPGRAYYDIGNGAVYFQTNGSTATLSKGAPVNRPY